MHLMPNREPGPAFVHAAVCAAAGRQRNFYAPTIVALGVAVVIVCVGEARKVICETARR
jgi:hypothetical protein